VTVARALRAAAALAVLAALVGVPPWDADRDGARIVGATATTAIPASGRARTMSRSTASTRTATAPTASSAAT
jgi:hypothetical protein